MDNIIEKIYKSCDKNDTNLVQVSALIEFIKPHMSNNLTELEELKAQLDPASTNPQIDYTFFQGVLSNWIEKIPGGEVKTSLSKFVSNITDSFNSSLSQNELESDNEDTFDINLKKQFYNLKCQWNKTRAKLDLSKKQLPTREKPNKELTADLQALRHKIQYRKQQFVGQSGDRSNESSEKRKVNLVHTRREQLEKIVTNYQKQQKQHLTKINSLENENQLLKIRLKSFENIKLEDRHPLTELQKNLDKKAVAKKEAEMSTLIAVPMVQDSPHKTLKKEIAQNSKEAKGIERLRQVIMDEFNVKVDLSKIMKKLETQNKTLLGSKEDQTNLIITNKNKDKSFEATKAELKNYVNKEKNLKMAETTMNKLQANSHEQLLFNSRLEKELAVISHNIQDEISNKCKNSLETLNKQLTIVETSLKKEKLNNFKLRVTFNINNKRILKKQKKIKKKLAREKRIKTKLSAKCRELSNQIDKIKGELSTYSDTVLKQTQVIDNLRFENENLAKSLKMLEQETVTLRTENSQLKNKRLKLMEEHHESNENLQAQVKLIDNLRSNNQNLVENFKMLEQETANLRIENIQLKYEQIKLIEANHILNENLQIAMHNLAVETTITAKLRAEINVLFCKNRDMSRNIKKKIYENAHLVRMRVTSDGVITRLREELSNKVNDIKILKKQIEVMNIDGFLAASNKELRRAILDSFNLLNCDRQRYQTVLDEEKCLTKTKRVLDLEEEMAIFNNNIKLMSLLFQALSDQQNLSNISRVTDLSDESDGALDDLHNIATNSQLMEATSLSCSSRIPQNTHDMFESMLPLQDDPFFENLELEGVDLKQLSQTELEEKFTNLALVLTVNITTSEKRCFRKLETFNRLASSFYTYLNFSLNTLKKTKKGQKNVIICLEKLKDISEDLFKSAVECGVLHYEKRMKSCWNMAINYVAILTQKNKKN